MAIIKWKFYFSFFSASLKQVLSFETKLHCWTWNNRTSSHLSQISWSNSINHFNSLLFLFYFLYIFLSPNITLIFPQNSTRQDFGHGSPLLLLRQDLFPAETLQLAILPNHVKPVRFGHNSTGWRFCWMISQFINKLI